MRHAQGVRANGGVEKHRDMNTSYGLAALLTSLLILIAITSCASQEQDDLRICEETATQGKPVSEQLACIYVIVQNPDTVLVPDSLSGEASTTYRAAMASLLASGYLVEVRTFRPVGEGWPDGTPEMLGYYPTAEGMEYLRRHKYPVRSWFERNWFVFSIAVVNISVAVSAIIIPLFRWQRRRGACTKL